MRITIPKTEYDKIYEQAMKVRPEEACGLIAGHDEDDKRVIEEVYVLTNSRPSEEDKRLANDSNASYLILSLMDSQNPVLNAFHVETVDGKKTVRKEELIIV